MTQARTSYLELAKRCNNFPSAEEARERYYELYIALDARPHGYLLPETVEKMPWTSDFEINHDVHRKVTVLDSSRGKDTAKAVNEAFSKLVTICIDRNLFHVLDRTHSEPFALLGANYPAYIERFASSLFGITACGAVLVAYVKTNDGMKIWIPKRAAHLYSYPGRLDTTVAGGVKAGVSPYQTMVEEAAEEASLSEQLVRQQARACGVITCMGLTGQDWAGEKGLVLPDVLYLYELELPSDVIPKPQDEEVDSFQSMCIPEVQDALLADKFKPDAAIVLIDFLMRHGILTAENERHYVEIIQHLHRNLPFPVKSQSS